MPPDRFRTTNPRAHMYARPQSNVPPTGSAPHRPPPVPYPTGHSSSSTSTIGGQDSNPSFDNTSSQPFSYPTPSSDSIGTIPLYPLLSRIRVHIVPTKLDGELPIMYSYVEDLGGIVSPIETCSIAVTMLKGRPRLLKVLGVDNVDDKWILSVDWLKRAHEMCVHYRTTLLASRCQGRIDHSTETEEDAESLKELDLAESQPASDTTTIPQIHMAPPELPSREEYAIPGTGSSARERASVDDSPPVIDDDDEEIQSGVKSSQYSNLPDLEPFPEDIRLEDIPNRAVQRCSPLVCVNQDIVCPILNVRNCRLGVTEKPLRAFKINAIKPIFQMREYDDPSQRNSNVLSYKRSMSILKSVPRRIQSGSEALRLLDLGPKVAERIDEFLETGHIVESEEILASDRFQAFELFSSIFTIGNAKARELYDDYGCRTLDDVLDYYAVKEAAQWDTGVVGQGIPTKYKSKPGGARFGVGEPKRRSRDGVRRRKEGRMSQAEIVREWIALKPDLDKKIPRQEVTEIAECIKVHLDALMPGCRYTVTGGYRRGKSESNDVDVVISPPTDDADVGQLLRDLYTRMADLGIVTHVLQLTAASHQFVEHNNFDGLDKAFVLFRLPPTPSDDGTGVAHRRLTRRVDFIMAPKPKYALAVLGWSGSMIFERDLKRYAENEMNLKFDSGRLCYRSTGEELFPKTEREIFDMMRLRYVRPQWRNADG